MFFTSMSVTYYCASYSQSIMATSPLWSFWTCQRPMTRRSDQYHDILIQRLEFSFVIADVVLHWIPVESNSHSSGASRSSAGPLVCVVPQGSVLSPVLFILYVADLAALIDEQYADDTHDIVYRNMFSSH